MADEELKELERTMDTLNIDFITSMMQVSVLEDQLIAAKQNQKAVARKYLSAKRVYLDAKLNFMSYPDLPESEASIYAHVQGMLQDKNKTMFDCIKWIREVKSMPLKEAKDLFYKIREAM